MRKSGAGRGSDEEADTQASFPYFGILDTVMGGRAAVDPVHLLDSAANPSGETTAEEATTEAEAGVGTDEATTEAEGRVDTQAEDQATFSGASIQMQSPPPSPAADSRPTTPGPAAGNSPATPCQSTGSCPTTPSELPDDDTPIPKKKRK